MALKTYLIDKSLTRRYLSPKHEVTLPNGEIVTYRLVKGDSTLEMKKQSPNADPKSLYFAGRLYSTENVTEQKFIESRPDFNKLITIYNPAEKAKEKNAEFKNTAMLIAKVAKFTDEEVMKYGYALFRADSLKTVKTAGIEDLHNDLIAYAGENPEKMNNLITDTKNADLVFAGYLIASGVLEVSIDNRYVTWGDSDAVVYTVPNGKDALEGLVDYFQTREGKEVLKEAGFRLESKTSKAVTQKATQEVVDTDTENETTDEVKEVKKGRFGRPVKEQ